MGLYKTFGGISALSGLSLVLRTGEVLGLIGPNGAGKTTLFNAICGFVRPEAGRILMNGISIVGMPPYRVTRLGIGRTFQDVRLIRKMSALDNVLLFCRDGKVWDGGSTISRSQGGSIGAAARCSKALKLLDKMGLGERAGDLAEELSYGQQKMLSLACCLASGAGVLLLDEPVAGIAPEMRETVLGMIGELGAAGRSIMLIEHDIEAVRRVCEHVVFMDAGAMISEGEPEAVRTDPRVIEAYL